MISFIKNHKLAAVLLVILVIVLVSKTNRVSPMSVVFPLLNQTTGTLSKAPTAGGMGLSTQYSSEAVPQTDVSSRMVIEESRMSLLVTNVVDVRKKVIGYAQSLGGYMVNSQVNNPQDAPTSTVTIRVPSVKLEEALDYLRSLGVKVVSENLTGYDVTDQYVDMEKRIAIYEKTKAKFEEILARAQEISDIINLNREIINIQSQIDALRGQKDYYAKNAELAKLTIYLSTDEMALPYAPSETFRPTVIFKQAVRSLVGLLRGLAVIIIWLVVYSIIWVPVVLAVWFIYRKISRGA